jgi:predicted membrane protein
MIIENRLEKRSFGPFGSSTGLFIFLGGLIIAYFSLTGIIIAIIGAFVAFTSTCTIIDTENRRIKHADYIFGLLPFGKWVNIQDSMKLGIKKVKRGYTGYIRGTQPTSIQYEDFRIFLYDSNNKQIMPVKKFQTYASAENELKEYAVLLRLSYSDLK